jgi:tetratricopeptide (TPR) repeat protein
MAYAVLQLVNIGAKQDKDLAKSKEIAEKALTLDPQSPKAHAVLGWIALWDNPRQVIDHFKKALLLSPDDSFGLQGLAIYYIQVVGKISEATPIIERLIQIDPLHFVTSMIQGLYRFYNGEYDLALPLLQRLYPLYPENPIILFYYAYTLVDLNLTHEAAVIIDQSVKTSPSNAFSKLGLMLKSAVLNEKDKVFQEMTSDLRKTCVRDISFSHHLAGIFAKVRANEEALFWLENAVEGGFINHPLLSEKDPFLENIRGEERFKKLMERVKHEWENFEV